MSVSPASRRNNTEQVPRNGKHRLTVAELATAKNLPTEFLRDKIGLRDGVEIPYRDDAGNEVAVKRRTAHKATEGSYWPKGLPLLAYGQECLDAARKARLLNLVEGESDCWAGWYHGIPALGIPGANATKVLAAEHLDGIEVVYIHREPDRGGQQFVQGATARLEALGFRGKVYELRLPEGIKDLADLHATAPEMFLARLEEAIKTAIPLQLHAAQTPGQRPAGEDSDRPTIVISTEEMTVNNQAIAALAKDDAIFHRGALLVRLVNDNTDTGGIRWSSGPRIEPLPRELLREHLAAVASWQQFKGDNLVPARPPGWCIGAVHARGQYPGLRHLQAVINHPVLRADGSILAVPGYDAVTGLYMDGGSDVPLPLLATPTHADARAAVKTLLEILVDFPIAGLHHQAAWLAALLTPLARFAFQGPAPLFLTDANIRGSGKGLLLDCISEIISGRRFTIAAYTADEDELRKRITSLALAGDRLVLLDNLEGRFGNATLDAALTGTVWKDRLLGVNRMAEAPLLMTWYATGNNVAVHADTVRRICHIRLESPLENPEERKDFHYLDLLRHIQERRRVLLAAALTILRAYCVAGQPRQDLPAWGSFQSWSDLVRSAVVWCGLPDPAATRTELQNRADVFAESMPVILDGLEQLDPDRHGLTASEIIDRIKQYIGPKAKDPLPAHLADLKDAIEAMAERLDARALGNKLRAYRRRIFGGKYLDIASTAKRAARWAVFPAQEFHKVGKRPQGPGKGECGESGESFPAGDRSVGDDEGFSAGGEKTHHTHQTHPGDAWEPPEDRLL
jgi:hypothetical protein